MIKRLITFFYLLAIPCLAGPTIVKFDNITCYTNAASQGVSAPVQNSKFSGKWVDTVIIDQTGSATGTVKIATIAGGGTGPSRNILLDTSVSADGVYPVRDIVTTVAGADISNVPARIPLYADKLTVEAYNYGDTNHTIDVYVILTDTP